MICCPAPALCAFVLPFFTSRSTSFFSFFDPAAIHFRPCRNKSSRPRTKPPEDQGLRVYRLPYATLPESESASRFEFRPEPRLQTLDFLRQRLEQEQRLDHVLRRVHGRIVGDILRYVFSCFGIRARVVHLVRDRCVDLRRLDVVDPLERGSLVLRVLRNRYHVE